MSTVLVLTAFDHEYQAVKKGLGPSNVPVFSTGMGMFKAREGVKKFFSSQEHHAVLVLGYCGGLTSKGKIGDVVVPKKIVSSGHKDGIPIVSALTDKVKSALHSIQIVPNEGVMYTSPTVVESPSSKRALANMSRADFVDMESIEIVSFVSNFKAPVVVIKVVIDDYQTTVPRQVRSGDEVLTQSDPERMILANMVQGAAILEKMAPVVVAAMQA